MENQAITIYVVCDEVLQIIGYHDDPQAVMSTAEVITFSILAGKLCGGNHKRARWLCRKVNYFPKILSESRLNRRLHKVPVLAWIAIFRFLALIFKESNSSCEYAVDSFPVASCAKARIDRRKFFKGTEFVGYAPSKKRHFCGVKVHMVVTIAGKPVELSIRPASQNDLGTLWTMELDLPKGAKLYADGAYNSYDLEDILEEDSQIYLLARRKHPNSRRKRCVEAERLIASRRQIVETAFSCITRMLPRSICARTGHGFLIRVVSAILAYSMDCLV